MIFILVYVRKNSFYMNLYSTKADLVKIISKKYQTPHFLYTTSQPFKERFLFNLFQLFLSSFYIRFIVSFLFLFSFLLFHFILIIIAIIRILRNTIRVRFVLIVLLVFLCDFILFFYFR